MTMKNLFAALLLISTTLPTSSHQAPSGWEYDRDCCHNQDCAPILKEDGDTVTTVHGTARKDTLILKPERPSKDLGDHACLVPMDDYGQSKAVRCLFRGRGV